MFGKITKEEIKIAEKLRAHLPLKNSYETKKTLNENINLKN